MNMSFRALLRPPFATLPEFLRLHTHVNQGITQLLKATRMWVSCILLGLVCTSTHHNAHMCRVPCRLRYVAKISVYHSVGLGSLQILACSVRLSFFTLPGVRCVDAAPHAHILVWLWG